MSLILVYDLCSANDDYEAYTREDMPAGIEPAAWAVLSSWMRHNNRSSELAHYVHLPRALVRKYQCQFTMGEFSIAMENWAAKLENPHAT